MGSFELWTASLDRSKRRRRLAADGRRRVARKKQASTAVTAAMLLSPAITVAGASGSKGKSEVAQSSPANRAIEPATSHDLDVVRAVRRHRRTGRAAPAAPAHRRGRHLRTADARRRQGVPGARRYPVRRHRRQVDLEGPVRRRRARRRRALRRRRQGLPGEHQQGVRPRGGGHRRQRPRGQDRADLGRRQLSGSTHEATGGPSDHAETNAPDTSAPASSGSGNSLERCRSRSDDVGPDVRGVRLGPDLVADPRRDRDVPVRPAQRPPARGRRPRRADRHARVRGGLRRRVRGGPGVRLRQHRLHRPRRGLQHVLRPPLPLRDVAGLARERR